MVLASKGMVERGQRYRLATSLNLAKPGQKYIDIPPGETLTLCRLEGAGRIVRFWLTLPLLFQRAALKDLVLRVYWDREAEPSVDVPIGDFFGASFGEPVPFVSERLLIAGGGLGSDDRRRRSRGCARRDRSRGLLLRRVLLSRRPLLHAELRLYSA